MRPKAALQAFQTWSGYQQKIDPPPSKERLAREVANLQQEQLLGESGEFSVYYAQAPQIPNGLQDIGRLREITFREVGEGTGKSSDVDGFDSYYTHLFVWHRENREIVGAYRLAKTDEILKKYGVSGLYSSTLFPYNPDTLEHINPALELGRSFVRSEYRKSYAPLTLLWKAISSYVRIHPRYKKLFGVVSISYEYETISQQLLAAFLKANEFAPDLAGLVEARHPFQFRKQPLDLSAVGAVKGVEHLSELLRETESDRKGIPILFKQYLKLGGKLLGFNVDGNFCGALDGLILVDLTRIEPRILEHFMGKFGAKEFLAFHQAKPTGGV